MSARLAAWTYGLALFLGFAGTLFADTAAFDLEGPSIEIKVTRNGKVLPISRVANLQPGDRIRIHPRLPPDQSAHYLLVAVFLRGATNPPPSEWFTRMETWKKKYRDEGISVTVPDGAEQALVFLAPETSGDFSTLRSAVRGRPGSFVRAAQDLEQASLDRSRLDTYLTAVREIAQTNPSSVHDRSVVLARSLNIRLDEDCFKKPVDEQASCLTQKSDNLVMNDGHSQSMVGVLTSGQASELIGQLAFTPQAGAGYFSPYIGAIMDMGRILENLHTAQYQYIPALGLAKEDELRLKLNNPPSFHNPKSVILAALPPVRTQEPPPLHPVDPEQAFCLGNKPLVLPVSGAPLAFSTALAHDVVLHIEDGSAKGMDLPATADAKRGGYVVDTRPLSAAKLPPAVNGVLRGAWGFDAFTGPVFKLQSARSVSWTIPAAETTGLVAGREHVFHLHAEAAACVQEVTGKDSQGAEVKVTWKVVKPDQLEVKVPAAGAKPGELTMLVKQTGIRKPDEVKAKVYAETGRLDQFVIVPGSRRGALRGSRLEEVASLELNGIRFLPAASHSQQGGELPLDAPGADATASLNPDGKEVAHVTLKDGRKLEVPATIESPRPKVTLLNKRVQLGAASILSAIHLTNEDELPLDGQISFSLKAEMPKRFPLDGKIEVATGDETFHTTLSIADGGLILQDSGTVVATFNPAKRFGNSAFGPLRFRAVDQRNIAGEWQPLATLVRMPVLESLTCPEDVTEQCVLHGTHLFLLDSIASDPQFIHAVQIPEGFVDSTLNVPRLTEPVLYIKLRDNPAVVNTATIQVSPAKVPQEPRDAIPPQPRGRE
ncbi:MAG TPA: hypothetical protein VHD76_19825 [Bryobacteraceae bacterium]|jgi:hypothetical protein|nr:hypothetical protein [Bryobacteraceae bacterium]